MLVSYIVTYVGNTTTNKMCPDCGNLKCQPCVEAAHLGMGTGKIAGQVAHAAVQAVHKIRKYNYEWYNSWLYEDDPPQTKIVLKVNSSSELIKLTHETPLNYLAFIHDA